MAEAAFTKLHSRLTFDVVHCFSGSDGGGGGGVGVCCYLCSACHISV